MSTFNKNNEPIVEFAPESARTRARMGLSGKIVAGALVLSIGLAGGAFILLSIIAKVSGVAAALSSVAASGGLEGESVAVIVKAIGIAYTTQIAAALCRDLGETALAVKTELIGRIMLMTLAVPLILKITEMLTELVRNSLTQ